METPAAHTYVFNPEDPTEMARLINQDRLTTRAMGGPLSGIDDPDALRNVLDLGCGPGGWTLDAAFELPRAEVEGIDISRIMVDYANARARTQQLLNASFGIMDITQPLDLLNSSYDLVNGRYLFPVLKRDAWVPFLSECLRVLRPGGILRLTETVNFGHSNSAAYQRLGSLITQAFRLDGYGYSPDGLTFGMDHILSTLVRQSGYQDVHSMVHAIDYRTYAADHYHNIEIIGVQVRPQVLKHGLITPDDFDQLLQQALIDIMGESYCGFCYLHTVIGQKPIGGPTGL